MIVIPYDDLASHTWFLDWMDHQMPGRLGSVFFDCAMTLAWKHDEQGQVIKDSYYHHSKKTVNRRLKRLWRFMPKNWRAVCTDHGVCILIDEPMCFWLLKQQRHVDLIIENFWEADILLPGDKNAD